jgi:hypothetical protein
MTLAIASSGAWGAGAPSAEAQRLDALERKLDHSLQTIEQLAARVQELEAELVQSRNGAPAAPAAPVALAPAPTEAAAPATTGAADERLANVERGLAQIAAAGQRSEDHGMPLHGFADVSLGNHNPIKPELKGASLGSVDFYLAPQLGARTRALVELNFEVGEGGSVGSDLERAQLGYQFTSTATAWIGRFHTPYGYYNTAFHHGQQISTSLRRPKFLQFEDSGGILPAHTVGAWITGHERVGASHVNYDLYVGNAQQIANGSLDMQSSGSSSGQLIVGGKFGVQPGGVDGLQVGFSALSARITDTMDASNVNRLNSVGLYTVYDTDSWENMAEIYFFRNRDLVGSSGTHSSNAGFIQVGYRGTGRYTPYLRYERAALDQSDGYFAAQDSGASYHREALGVHFDLDLKSAVKLELAQTHVTDRLPYSYSDALLQFAVRF